MNPSPDDDDAARIFRENDTVGDSSSFWYRATRQYFEQQKPVGSTILLSTGPTSDEQLPLGLFTYTSKSRLVYWPALDKDKKRMVLDDGEIVNIFDHITLEFPSEKMHLTWVNEEGKKNRRSMEARTFRFDSLDLAICFQILVKIEVLQSQDMAVQRKVKVPDSHKPRMTEWLKNFAESLIFPPTRLTESYKSCDYVHYSVLLASSAITAEQLPPVSNILSNDGMAKYVDGWKTDEPYPVYLSRLTVADQTLIIATACPPGKLNHPSAFQIARRRLRKPS